MEEQKTYAQLKAGTIDLEVLYGYVDTKGRVYSVMGKMSEDHLATVFDLPGHNQRGVRSTWRYVPAFDILFWWDAPTEYDKEMSNIHIKKKFPGARVINRMMDSQLNPSSNTLSKFLSHGHTFGPPTKIPSFKEYWKYKHGGD